MPCGSIHERQDFGLTRHPLGISIEYPGVFGRSGTNVCVIKLSTPNRKRVSLPKTAALTKAQVQHKAWLKAHVIKVTKNTLCT